MDEDNDCLDAQGTKTATNYYIVSSDKGFEAVTAFWKNQGISVSCISAKIPDLKATQLISHSVVIKTASETKQKKKKSKVSAKDLATIDEIKHLIGDSKEVQEVLAIVNQYKTKLAINNGLTKLYKDGKRTSEVYKRLKPLLKTKHKS